MVWPVQKCAGLSETEKSLGRQSALSLSKPVRPPEQRQSDLGVGLLPTAFDYDARDAVAEAAAGEERAKAPLEGRAVGVPERTKAPACRLVGGLIV